MVEQERPKVAYLGPVGTYSHQSAYDKFGDNVQYIECPKVRDVFNAVSPDILYGLVPQENTIFGPVTETYDMLRLSEVGERKYIRGEVTLAVQHCLIVRRGVKREDITKILSHDQALGQCQRYISENFPNAALQKTMSTAAAAQALLEEETYAHSAAICSKLCAKVFDGLEVLQESIQDTNTNFTRFYILATSLEVIPPFLPSRPQLQRALVRLSLRKREGDNDSEDALSESTIPPLLLNRPLQTVIGTLLTSFGVPVTRIDRRPSSNPVPFEQMYFVELEEPGSGFEEQPAEFTRDGWLKRVRMGIERVEAAGVTATIIGLW